MGAVLSRDLDHDYPTAVRSLGMEVFDETGKAYLDMCGGAAVSALGHQDPEIISILQSQIGQMAYAHTGHFTNRPQETLASALVTRFGDPQSRVYFTSGGSEANETALKLAWQYWRLRDQPAKTKIISRQFSYHGNTVGALSASGSTMRRGPVSDILLDWPRIDPCYAYRYQRDDESAEAYGARAAAALEQAIEREGADTIAAFIVEPVSGASLGAVPPVEGYLKRLRAICDHYNILMIADEVMCGTGRTGSFFAFEQDEFRPDVVTLAKGIGGGYQPLAATIASGRIVHAFEDQGRSFAHGHTYIGHASACAAGSGVLDVIEKRQLLGAVRRMGDILHKALEVSFGAHRHVGDLRGRGLLRAIEFVEDRDTKRPFAKGAQLARRLRDVAMSRGLICYPSGGDTAAGHGCHILLAPPFIVEKHHIDQMIGKLDSVLREVFDG